MANTEGLSDETVDSLLDLNMSGTRNTNDIHSQRKMMLQQQRGGLEGLELNSTNPAAKVIRKSTAAVISPVASKGKNNSQGNFSSTAKLRVSDNGAKATNINDTNKGNPTTTTTMGEMMVGNIRERGLQKGSRRRRKLQLGHKPSGCEEEGNDNDDSCVSRFQKNRNQSNSKNTNNHENGFPSVKHLPLGTFVNKNKRDDDKMKQQQQQSTRSNKNNSTMTTNTISPATTINLEEEAQKDANRLLQNMSMLEIQQHQQELTTLLSPETVNFLKQRQSRPSSGAERQQKQSDPQDITRNQGQATTEKTEIAANYSDKRVVATINNNNNPESSSPAAGSKVDEAKYTTTDDYSKQRLAEVLSGVRNYEDMDNAVISLAPPNVTNNDDAVQSESATSDSIANGGVDSFNVACDLLRSTVPRQTLWAARTVHYRLARDVTEIMYIARNDDDNAHSEAHWLLQLLQPTQPDTNNGKSTATIAGNKGCIPGRTAVPPSSQKYARVLIVSLRCLLDAPFQQHGYVLHTHVLQSIYLLLQLRACPDHVAKVGVNPATESEKLNDGDYTEAVAKLATVPPMVVYQEHFMHDAVPTPQLQDCYQNTSSSSSSAPQPLSVESSNGTKISNVAYSTGSNAESAKSDAHSFWTDPMWTLLSKMRMLPRLATLLATANHHDSDIDCSNQNTDSMTRLPVEALQAICGILAMMAQRSAGAATAIVQHSTLLGDLHQLAVLVEQPKEERCHENSALVAALVLYTTLARQSRVAAQGVEQIFVGAWVHRVLSQENSMGQPGAASTETNLTSLLPQRRWTLILWRTLLRYGFALEPLSDIVVLAARSVSLGSRYTEEAAFLCPDYFMAFAAVQRCAWVCLLGETPQRSVKTMVGPDQLAILKDCPTWLDFSIQQAVVQLGQIKSNFGAKGSLHHFRHAAACVELIESSVSVQAAATAKTVSSDGTPAGDAATVNVDDTVSVVQSVLSSDIFDRALELVAPSLLDGDLSGFVGGADLPLEAAAAAFLCGFVRLVRTIVGNTSAVNKPKAINLRDSVSKSVFDTIEAASQANRGKGGSIATMPRSRRAWLNQTHTALLTYIGEDAAHSCCIHVKGLACALLGRLQHGEESLAINLLSCDTFFRDSTSSETSLGSMVSTVFIRELCESKKSRAQVDHSFKRHGGLGVTVEGIGPFELQSLTSPTISGGPAGNKTALLPLGSLWLWQLLSGSSEPENSETGSSSSVFSATMELIHELENSGHPFSSQIPAGAKMYYLMNLCCQPEAVTSDERIKHLFLDMLDRYTANLSPLFTTSFGDACMRHAAIHVQMDSKGKAPAPSSDSNEAKVMAILEGDDVPTNTAVSKTAVRAMVDFIGDLCDRFIDDGGRDVLTAHCLRLFLFPNFPGTVRQDLLHRLNGLLHLLTTEDDDTERIITRFICWGGGGGGRCAPSDPITSSDRLTPAFLNDVSNGFEESSSSLRCIDGGFLCTIVVTVLSANLAHALLNNDDDTGVLASTRRLLGLHSVMQNAVLKSLTLFASSRDRTCSDLIESVRKCVPSSLSREEESTEMNDDDDALTIPQLKERF